jgi:hypothetical protein
MNSNWLMIYEWSLAIEDADKDICYRFSINTDGDKAYLKFDSRNEMNA